VVFDKFTRNTFWQEINQSTFQWHLIRQIKGKVIDAEIAPDKEKREIIKISEIRQGMRQQLPLSHTHYTYIYIYIYIYTYIYIYIF
jgi:hypothetical protein